MAHDADGDGNLDVGEFSNMLQKVVEGESAWHNLLLHRRMYSNMCMWPRVDASVFVKVTMCLCAHMRVCPCSPILACAL
jgi:hypothetical protein